jgi:hypothetical protein
VGYSDIVDFRGKLSILNFLIRVFYKFTLKVKFRNLIFQNPLKNLGYKKTLYFQSKKKII